VKSGIGKVMSALAVAVLVDRFDVDAIINTGSAGGVGTGLAIGDVVVADQLAYHDVDVTAFGSDFGQMAQQPLYFESSRYFNAQLEQVLPTVKKGLITSSDSFINSADQIAAIKAHFPEVLAVEMEGASIAQAAHAMNKPFTVIRAISDVADSNSHVDFDSFIIEAGKQSAQTVIKLLGHME
jgi:adenosylhomocysteine nucleosidase